MMMMNERQPATTTTTMQNEEEQQSQLFVGRDTDLNSLNRTDNGSGPTSQPSCSYMDRARANPILPLELSSHGVVIPENNTLALSAYVTPIILLFYGISAIICGAVFLASPIYPSPCDDGTERLGPCRFGRIIFAGYIVFGILSTIRACTLKHNVEIDAADGAGVGVGTATRYGWWRPEQLQLCPTEKLGSMLYERRTRDEFAFVVIRRIVPSWQTRILERTIVACMVWPVLFFFSVNRKDPSCYYTVTLEGKDEDDDEDEAAVHVKPFVVQRMHTEERTQSRESRYEGARRIAETVAVMFDLPLIDEEEEAMKQQQMNTRTDVAATDDTSYNPDSNTREEEEVRENGDETQAHKPLPDIV